MNEDRLAGRYSAKKGRYGSSPGRYRLRSRVKGEDKGIDICEEKLVTNILHQKATRGMRKEEKTAVINNHIKSHTVTKLRITYSDKA